MSIFQSVSKFIGKDLEFGPRLLKQAGIDTTGMMSGIKRGRALAPTGTGRRAKATIQVANARIGHPARRVQTYAGPNSVGMYNALHEARGKKIVTRSMAGGLALLPMTRASQSRSGSSYNPQRPMTKGPMGSGRFA